MLLSVSKLEVRRPAVGFAHDLLLAREIQTGLLPRALPQDGQLDVAARSLPSGFLTGDFYECLAIDPQRIGLAVGDAMGKGLPAALLSSQVQALLKAGFHRALPELVATLSAHLLTLGERAHCVTLFCGVYERASGRLRYVNAGHNPPVVLRADGCHELLETGGMLLGAFPDLRYEVGTLRLRDGDSMLVYSDGLTETCAPDGEPYGEARVLEMLRLCRGRAAHELLRALEADASAFRRSPVAQDDLTMLALRRP